MGNYTWRTLYTLVFLINVLHVYLFLRYFSIQHALIRNNTFIYFQEIFLPTCLFSLFKMKKRQRIVFLPVLWVYFLLKLGWLPNKMFKFTLKKEICFKFALISFHYFPPTCLLGTTRLLISGKFSLQHVYSIQHVY